MTARIGLTLLSRFFNWRDALLVVRPRDAGPPTRSKMEIVAQERCFAGAIDTVPGASSMAFQVVSQSSGGAKKFFRIVQRSRKESIHPRK